LKKPGYIAFEMMKRLSTQMIEKGEDYIITKGVYNSYTIMMCNHIGLSAWYCEHMDNPLELKNVYTAFDKMESKNISFTLNGIEDGEYRLISYHLNRECGSIFDEWSKTDFWTTPNMREVEYLRTVLHPKRNYGKKKSINNQLEIQMNLQPLEVVVLEIAMEE